MDFITIDEVREKFKDKKADFHKSYFDAFNNSKRYSEDYNRLKKKIDELLINGKMNDKVYNLFEGITQALKDKGLLK